MAGYIGATGVTFSVTQAEIEDKITLDGDTGVDGTIKKNAASGRDELQIYAGTDAYQSGSHGAGIHLYGNDDSDHDGDIALLTGPDDNGDARLMVSGREDKAHVTIGNAIWDYVDDGDDHALLNLKDPTDQPALLIEGASNTEGDITTIDGESLQFGHWNKTTSTFTHRMSMDSAGNLEVGDIETGTNAPIAVKTNSSGHALLIEENSGAETWQVGVNVDGDLNFFNSGATSNPAMSLQDSGTIKFANTGDLDVIISADTDNVTESDNPRLILQQDGEVDHLTLGVAGANNDGLTGVVNNGSYLKSKYDLHLGVGTNVGLTINDNNQVTMPKQPRGWMIKTSSSQQHTTGSTVKVTFDTSTGQNGVTFNNTNDRLTIPATGAGTYFISVMASMSVTDLNAGDGLRLHTYKNGSKLWGEYGIPLSTSGTAVGVEFTFSDSFVVPLANSDYIELWITDISSGNTDFYITTAKVSLYAVG